jgi:type I restriction enzyme M protein
LGIVLPESLLNSKEMVGVRLLLYRFFTIRAIVSMPRNIFIDTPTLTSLLFAEKKSKAGIAEWDAAWAARSSAVEKAIKTASAAISKNHAESHSAVEVAEGFLGPLKGIIDSRDWISKVGKSPVLLTLKKDWGTAEGPEAASYYREILGTAGFRSLCQGHIFGAVATKLGYNFGAYEVDEIGYKLSKRREKARSNQLCRFEGVQSGEEISNVHISDEEYVVRIDAGAPTTILDYIRRDVNWGGGQ